MLPKVDNAIAMYREEGGIHTMKRAIRFGYNNYIRPLLPTQEAIYNDVSVRSSHIGDSIVPWQSTKIPDYEESLIRGIRDHVEDGDDVVIVGGGEGVSTVVAARKSGDSGSVTTFEGSSNAVKKIKNTVQLNNVDTQVSIRHAIVARAVSLRGKKGCADIISPNQLPECDVMILDCEGAEIDILEELESWPGTLIVETHGIYGATKPKVNELLNNVGYNIIAEEIAEERLRKMCEENGIYVLTAEQA